METAFRSSCLSSQQLAHDYLFYQLHLRSIRLFAVFFVSLFAVNGKIVRITLSIVNATDYDYGVGRFEEGRVHVFISLVCIRHNVSYTYRVDSLTV